MGAARQIPVDSSSPLPRSDRLPSIRLPRTANRRGAICFAQVITGFEARPVNGFGFEGRRYAAGAAITEEELHAGGARDPVLFECTEKVGDFPNDKRRKWEGLYILWRYRRETRRWEEIARVSGQPAQARWELQPIARRELAGKTLRIAPSAEQVADRIRDSLDKELSQLDVSQRGTVLVILSNLVNSWVVGEQEWGLVP